MYMYMYMYNYMQILILMFSLCVVDVAIIDEAQMMRDSERGGAWTRAILGKETNNY